jgi:hypothetical protein
MVKSTTDNPYSICSNFDVYIEITVERKIKVSAASQEEAMELGVARAKNYSSYLTKRSGYKVLEFEAIDAVEHNSTSS